MQWAKIEVFGVSTRVRSSFAERFSQLFSEFHNLKPVKSGNLPYQQRNIWTWGPDE